MRDRLKELLKDTLQEWECDVSDDTIDQISDHLIENGVIVPPVVLGSRQKVYIPIKSTTVVYETKVYGIGIDEDGGFVINPKEYPEDAIEINGYNIGKTVFLTREEAKRALERSENGKS